MDNSILQLILKKLDRIENLLREKRVGKAWVTAQGLTLHTGWDKERMRRARLGKEVEFKKVPSGGYRYNLGSVNPVFLKPQQASENIS